jgi:large subunit ribosomal protein L29
MAESLKVAIQDLSEQELAAKSVALRKQLFEARLQKSTARLEKTHVIRALRRDIARCETKLTQLRLINA